MSLDLINVGAEANDGTGDTPRAAFTKVNAAIAAINDLPAATDFSGAISTLSTDVAALETVQGSQAGAIAAAQGAIATLTTDVAALQSAPAPTDYGPAIAALEIIQGTKRDNAATVGALPYAATVNLDMAELSGSYQQIALTGPLTLTTSNRGAGREVSIDIAADASSRALTFPAGWRFYGAARPTAIAANKVAMLTVTFFGTGEANARCAYAVEP